MQESLLPNLEELWLSSSAAPLQLRQRMLLVALCGRRVASTSVDVAHAALSDASSNKLLCQPAQAVVCN
jgi:hypothetical protein